MDYDEYIASAEWRAKRELALARDNFRCRGCDAVENLEVHHRRYPAALGEETLDDLTTLCGGPDGCHAAITNLIRGRRYAERIVKVDDIGRLGPEGNGSAGRLSAVDLQDYGRLAPDHAQRRAGEPAQPDREGDAPGVG